MDTVYAAIFGFVAGCIATAFVATTFYHSFYLRVKELKNKSKEKENEKIG